MVGGEYGEFVCEWVLEVRFDVKTLFSYSYVRHS